jgi:hypothetical protein
MGRFDVYDSDELPSSEHLPSSDGHVRDTATEVRYEFAAQIPFLATHCRFDRDDDLIYGDEVELVHVDGEPLRLAIPNQGPRVETPLKVVTTTDKQWRLAWLHHCSWPYSINYRQIGRIRTYSKKAKPDSFWATTVERLQRGAGLIEATESHPFDPFVHVNSSGKRTSPPMKGYMRPDRRHDDLFSNETGNSERQKFTRRMEAPDDQDELARRLGLPRQVRLWGICADKDLQKAHDYLRKELKDLYDYAKAGVIRRKYLYLTKRLSLKKDDLDGMELPEAVPPQVDRMLEACIHIALCGPVGPNEFRGYSPSTGDDAPPHKLTVATHARFLFVDNLRLYALRLANPEIRAYTSENTSYFADKPKEEVNDTSEPVPPSLSAEALESRLEETIVKLKEFDLGNIPFESMLEASCRKGEIEDMHKSILIAVSVHQLTGKPSERVRELITKLCDEPWPELSQAARWARKKMTSVRK